MLTEKIVRLILALNDLGLQVKDITDAANKAIKDSK